MRYMFYRLLSSFLIMITMPLYACLSEEVKGVVSKEIVSLQKLATHAFICYQAKLINKERIEDRQSRMVHLKNIFSHEKHQQFCEWQGCAFHGKSALVKKRKKIATSVVLLAGCYDNIAAAYLIKSFYNTIPYGLRLVDLSQARMVQQCVKIFSQENRTITKNKERSAWVKTTKHVLKSWKYKKNSIINSLVMCSGLLTKEERYDVLMHALTYSAGNLPAESLESIGNFIYSIATNVMPCLQNHLNKNWESDRFERFKQAIISQNYETAYVWLSSIMAPFVNERYADRQLWAEEIFKSAKNKQQLLPLLGDFLSEQTLVNYVATLKCAKKDIYDSVFKNIERIIHHMSWERASTTAACLKDALKKEPFNEALLPLINPLSKAIVLRPHKQRLDKKEEDIHLVCMHPLADAASKAQAVKLFKSFNNRHVSFYKDCLTWLFFNPLPANASQEIAQEGIEYLIGVLSKPKNKKALRNRFFEEEKIAAYEQPALIKKNQWPGKLVIQALSAGFLWNELNYYMANHDQVYLNDIFRGFTDKELSSILSNLQKTCAYGNKHNQLNKTLATLQELTNLLQQLITVQSPKIELS